MPLKSADRVKETSTTTGTGTYSLAGAVAGFRTFVAGIGDTNTCFYCAEDGTDWEVGIGTVADASPDTLARTTILASSNAGAAVNWGVGTRNLFCTHSAGGIAINAPVDNVRLRLSAHSTQTANLLEAYNTSAALRAKITGAGEFSNTQGLSDSEAFGAGATVTASMNTAFGAGASATGASRASAFGQGASASGNRAVAFGAGAIASGEGSIAIGNVAAAGGASVIGNVAIGYSSGTSSNTIGPWVAIGYGANPAANNQGLLGGASGPITDWYLGKGVTHVTVVNVAVQPTGASGTNIAGGNLIVGGGKGTGNAIGGSVKIQTSTAGASGTTLQTLATVAEFGVAKIGFFGVTPAARPSAYTPTNVTANRAYDADTVVVAELADVVGTLIADLQTLGLLN